MHWSDVPAFYAELATKDAMAAKALMFTCLTGDIRQAKSANDDVANIG
jgi:hypothetical protein